MPHEPVDIRIVFQNENRLAHIPSSVPGSSPHTVKSTFHPVFTLRTHRKFAPPRANSLLCEPLHRCLQRSRPLRRRRLMRQLHRRTHTHLQLARSNPSATRLQFSAAPYPNCHHWHLRLLREQPSSLTRPPPPFRLAAMSLRKDHHRIATIHRLAGMRKAPAKAAPSWKRKYVVKCCDQPVPNRREQINDSIILPTTPPQIQQYLARHRNRYMPPQLSRQRIQNERPVVRRHMVCNQQYRSLRNLVCLAHDTRRGQQPYHRLSNQFEKRR